MTAITPTKTCDNRDVAGQNFLGVSITSIVPMFTAPGLTGVSVAASTVVAADAAPIQPDAFNYIVALQLLIVAIGITKILEGVSWIIEHGKCTRYWAHTLGAALVALLLLQYAWASFYDYSVSRWTFVDFLLECTTPLIYLFVADLLFLDSAPENCNLRDVYALRIKLIAALVMAAQVVNSVLDVRYHPDEQYVVAQHIIRFTVIIILGGLFTPFPRFKWLHETVIVLLFIALLVFCLSPLTPDIRTR